MTLRTVTLIAAITQLLGFLCSVAAFGQSLMELAHGRMRLEHNLIYVLATPVHLLAGLALTFFLFFLVTKQQN